MLECQRHLFLSISAKFIEGYYQDNGRRENIYPMNLLMLIYLQGTLPTSPNKGASLTPAQHCKRKLETGLHMYCQSAPQWPVLGTTNTSTGHLVPTFLVSSFPAKVGYYVLHTWVQEGLLGQICNYSLLRKPWILAISKFYMTRIIKCFGCSQHIFW